MHSIHEFEGTRHMKTTFDRSMCRPKDRVEFEASDYYFFLGASAALDFLVPRN